MGAGSTLAAANAVGYASIGVERDDAFFDLARNSIAKLSSIPVKNDAQLFSSPGS
jgi:site-specific DNA-methyltransferase (adenine-specific)